MGPHRQVWLWDRCRLTLKVNLILLWVICWTDSKRWLRMEALVLTGMARKHPACSCCWWTMFCMVDHAKIGGLLLLTAACFRIWSSLIILSGRSAMGSLLTDCGCRSPVFVHGGRSGQSASSYSSWVWWCRLEAKTHGLRGVQLIDQTYVGPIS